MPCRKPLRRTAVLSYCRAAILPCCHHYCHCLSRGSSNGAGMAVCGGGSSTVALAVAQSSCRRLPSSCRVVVPPIAVVVPPVTLLLPLAVIVPLVTVVVRRCPAAPRHHRAACFPAAPCHCCAARLRAAPCRCRAARRLAAACRCDPPQWLNLPPATIADLHQPLS